MAYDITVWFKDRTVDPLTKGPITILPGEAINNKTSITLVGQGAMHYGKAINENFLHLLENFASDKEPQFPTVGQLWWKRTTIENTLMVCRQISSLGPVWVPVSTNYWSGPTPPPYNTWLWYDTSNANNYEHQLKIYNEVTKTWDSVARRYVLKTGDEMTGDLTFRDQNEGVKGTYSGITGLFSPTTAMGPSTVSTGSAAVVINGNRSAPFGREFVIGAHSMEPVTATNSSNRLVSVKDDGTVTIHKNVLNMGTFKVTNMADGVFNMDAVNFRQLTNLRVTLETRIKNVEDNLSDLADLVDTKVSKFGDTMSGALVINSTLTVSNDVTFRSNARVEKSLTVLDNASIGKKTTTDTFEALRSAVIGTTLQVKGDATLDGNALVKNGLQVQLNTAIGGKLDVSGVTTLQGLAFMMQARSSITNAKHLTNKEYVDYTVTEWHDPSKVNKVGDTMTGNLTINASLVVRDDANIGRDLTVTRNVVVNGSTTTKALSSTTGTFSGALTAQATLSVTGTSSMTGNVSMAGTLSVSNTVTMGSTLSVTGAATLNTVSTMNVASTAITNARHLTTKEYVDGKIAVELAKGGMAAGWIAFNGNNGAVINSKNLTLARTGAGQYTIHIAAGARGPNANYTVVVGAMDLGTAFSGQSGNWGNRTVRSMNRYAAFTDTQAQSYFTIKGVSHTGGIVGAGNDDLAWAPVIYSNFGDHHYITAVLFI